MIVLHGLGWRPIAPYAYSEDLDSASYFNTLGTHIQRKHDINKYGAMLKVFPMTAWFY
jgi:hypothetical protein